MDQRIKKNCDFLENIFRKGPFRGHAFTVSTPRAPSFQVGDFTTSDRPVREWLPWIAEGYQKWKMFMEKVGDDSVPLVGFNTGTHIYASAFGAETHYFNDSAPCAMPFIQTTEEAERVREPELYECKTLMRIFEMAELVKKELGSDTLLGPPDMQSGFDTACLIWNKQDIFCSMLMDEEKGAVHRLAGKCANLLKKFIGEFYRLYPDGSLAHCPTTWIPQGMGPWVSNDECGAISVPMFEEFCLPELIDLATTFGGLGMHCCADAEHQFPSFRKIPNFYAFNRVAAKHGYDPILEIFRGAQSPVFVLMEFDDISTERMIRIAPEGTRFIFNRSFDKIDDAKAWIDKMRQISPRIE